jgi:uncharacterized protein GlcG (DUF336 family)
MVNIAETISSAQTATAIAADEAHAAAIGVAANVAVLDAAAHLKGFLRMDGAVLGSIDIAIGKARTAALFAASSEVVWEDPREMIDRMIAIVPADTGKFRNVCPQFVEEMLKDVQAATWTAEI